MNESDKSWSAIRRQEHFTTTPPTVLFTVPSIGFRFLLPNVYQPCRQSGQARKVLRSWLAALEEHPYADGRRLFPGPAGEYDGAKDRVSPSQPMSIFRMLEILAGELN